MLTVDFNNEQEALNLQEDWLNGIARAMMGAVKAEGIDASFDVCVLFTDDEHIRELNRDFRGIDSVTDVLSFPANDLRKPLSLELFEEDFVPEEDIETGKILLGDIALSVPRAMRQAEAYGHSVLRELAFLCVHGILHLMGYDHGNPQDDKIMCEKQCDALIAAKILRD